MLVKELIFKLLDFPQDVEVNIDTDDGVKGNYMPVLGVRKFANVMGEVMVVIESDLTKRE